MGAIHGILGSLIVTIEKRNKKINAKAVFYLCYPINEDTITLQHNNIKKAERKDFP